MSSYTRSHPYQALPAQLPSELGDVTYLASPLFSPAFTHDQGGQQFSTCPLPSALQLRSRLTLWRRKAVDILQPRALGSWGPITSHRFPWGPVGWGLRLSVHVDPAA